MQVGPSQGVGTGVCRNADHYLLSVDTELDPVLCEPGRVERCKVGRQNLAGKERAVVSREWERGILVKGVIVA